MRIKIPKKVRNYHDEWIDCLCAEKRVTKLYQKALKYLSSLLDDDNPNMDSIVRQEATVHHLMRQRQDAYQHSQQAELTYNYNRKTKK
jgi:hypothetical protein